MKCELIELDLYNIKYMPFNGAETSCSWWTRGMRMSIAKCSMTRATHRGGLGKVRGLAVSYGRLTPPDSCSNRHEQKMDWCYTTSALIIIFKRQRCGRQCSIMDPVYPDSEFTNRQTLLSLFLELPHQMHETRLSLMRGPNSSSGLSFEALWILITSYSDYPPN